MNAMLASIVINNYNYGRFLGVAIDSALAQAYRHTEVIVVDDGSTDNSREVIRRYGNQVKGVFKANGGQGSTYNAGFSASCGDFIHFLDADDTLFPNAMDEVAQLFKAPTAPVQVQWPLRVIDGDGTPTGETSVVKSPPEGDLLYQQMLDEGPIYDFLFHTGRAYRRDFLQRVLPVPEQPYRHGADMYFVTLAPAYGQVVNISRELGTYRHHGSNNYCGRQPTEDWLRECLRRFETNASALEQHLLQLNVKVAPERWRQRNFNYLWPSRLLEARNELDALIPPRSQYILVDGCEWGNGQLINGRQAIRLRERHGDYWGPPSDDTEATVELERMREGGAQFIVFWWTQFWWFENFPTFTEYLARHFKRVMASDRIVVFELRTPCESTLLKPGADKLPMTNS